MKSSLVLLLILGGSLFGQVCAPVVALQPNSTVSGALSASNCALSDGTLYADYLVVFPVHGTWNGTVTAADGITPLTLILRDLSGVDLYSGANAQGAVERGTYHVMVNGGAVGFQLASSFTPAANVLCWNFAQAGTIRTVNGLLGPASCQLPDGSVYDGYQLTLYGSGTVDLAVNAFGFTPLIILRTSDGYSLPGTASTDANGVYHLVVDAVGNDTYTLVVAVSSPDQGGGAYSVAANFTPDDGEVCVSQGALTASQQVNGTISPLTCNFNLPGRDDNALFNFYSIHLDQAGVVQASIVSSDFSPLLLLMDADGNEISEDIESGGNGNPLLQEQLAPGDYVLAVFNEDSFGGNFSLNYQYTAGSGPACPVVTMNPGDDDAGTLVGGTSCADFGYLADTYQLVLPTSGTVTLLLSSPVFTAFVDLHDAKDNELTWGAPTADGSGSFLTATLPAGTYYAKAASMDLPGGYSLSYTFTPAPLSPCPTPMPMLPNGFIQNAQLGSGSCEGKDGRIADYYSFTLPAASTQAVFMLSSAIPPYVTLLQSDGTPLRSDENSWLGSNGAILQYLPAGNYLVKARSADPNATGLYSLYLNFAAEAPQLCAPLSLPLNSPVSGQTAFTSCFWYDGTFADVYALNVTDPSQQLAITAQTTAPNAFLLLMDAKGDLLATDQNDGSGSNPQITQGLDPGLYFVVVKPLSDPTSAFSYSLTATASANGTSDMRKRKN